MNTLAFVLLKFKDKQNMLSINDYNYVKEKLESIEGVKSVNLIEKGDLPYEAIIRVSTDTIESLYHIVMRGIAKSSPVLETTTLIVLDQ